MNDIHPTLITGEKHSYETGVVEAYLGGATYFKRLSETTTKFWRVQANRLEYALLRNVGVDKGWRLEGWYACENQLPNTVSLL